MRNAATVTLGLLALSLTTMGSLGCGAASDGGEPTPPTQKTDSSPSGDLDQGLPPSDDTSPGSDDTAVAPTDGEGADTASPGADTSAPVGLTTLGTLVILGDSIGDGGGGSPFYYDLLKGDLGKRYGSIGYQHAAVSGSKTSDLSNQIDALPAKLAGPVAVCITSGGNDMKAVFPQVVTGTDGAARTAMGDNIKRALDKLLAPGRFGAGVEVHVYEGNIYDASDGAGDFGSHGCKFVPAGYPASPSDKYFDAWNSVIATQVTAHKQMSADMHTYFYGHGYKVSPDWYATDCTHPSTLGHDNLRRLFYFEITGEKLP
jgi:lysophospholipase L1-like esterase